MTRTALLVALILAGVLPGRAFAQFGVKGGLSFSTLSTSGGTITPPDFKNQTGFTAGVALRLGGGMFALQPEALYARKGAPTDAGASLKLTYLEVPVLVRLNIPIGGITPFAVAGPYADFQLKCESSGTGCDNAKSTDYGVALGAGVRLGGKTGFTIEGRYDLGLQNINQVSEGFDAKNRAFLLLLGVEF